MAQLANDNGILYFDRVIRVHKMETIHALIFATYHTKETGVDRKKLIALKLKEFYKYFKDDIGTYEGRLDQFDSQYTIGHEVGVWKDSSLALSDMAIQVAESRITTRDYLDVIFLNYIQPVNGEMCHPLFKILNYLKTENGLIITHDEIMTIIKSNDEDIRGLCHFLNGTNYFSFDSRSKILRYIYNLSVDQLLEKVNLKYLNMKFEEAKHILSDKDVYLEYLHSRDVPDSNKVFVANEFSKGLIGSNELYYGVPGSGKSYLLNEKFSLNSRNSLRTVFYPDYSNSDFVGQIIPTIKEQKPIYEFVPGPFTLSLVESLRNKSDFFYLVIEEINRGNASSIFGEIFQLLDRDNTGTSAYRVRNKSIEAYLESEGLEVESLFIPNNLVILATMNTSDQNVFTLDNAFKRRWNMIRVKNEFSDDHKLSGLYVPGTSTKWSTFVKQVNENILKNNQFGINSEDKQLGSYYVSENELSESPHDKNEMKCLRFAEKVFHYLWEDVAKLNRSEWFNEEFVSFEDLIDDYIKNGLSVFNGLFNEERDNV